MRRRLLGVFWALVGILLLARGAPPPPAPPIPPLPRLLGPFAELGAELAWLRFQAALLAGEDERALGWAETALALDPVSTAGWERLATWWGLDRASPTREPSPALRRAWFAAGLDAARRGEATARHPERLALLRGVLCLTRAAVEPELSEEQRRGLRAQAAGILGEGAAHGAAERRR